MVQRDNMFGIVSMHAGVRTFAQYMIHIHLMYLRFRGYFASMD